MYTTIRYSDARSPRNALGRPPLEPVLCRLAPRLPAGLRTTRGVCLPPFSAITSPGSARRSFITDVQDISYVYTSGIDCEIGIIENDGQFLAKLVLERPEKIRREFRCKAIWSETDQAVTVVGDRPQHVHPLSAARDWHCRARVDRAPPRSLNSSDCFAVVINHDNTVACGFQ